MNTDGWKYYNYAVLPTTKPHEEPDLTPVKSGSIWKMGDKTPLLVRWTSDYDCGNETNWWYVVKDTPFDISALKSKRRYEINKGNKNFLVKEIEPEKYAEDIYRVAVAAYETYPKSYRPNTEHDSFIENIRRWDFYKVYGAFSIEDDSLCGYACLSRKDMYISFVMMKVIPAKEKLGLNAAIVCHMLLDHEQFLSDGGYICDGARSIQHETAFQDYLEKYFGFRKAFCQLHIVYNPKYKPLIHMAYLFRKVFKKICFIPGVGKINALLRMEEINRSEK